MPDVWITQVEAMMEFKEMVGDCLKGIRDAYSQSWNSILHCGGSGEKSVIRGRARCISGQVEDLIAEMVYDYAAKELEDVVVFVDLPLSYETGEYDEKGVPEFDICYPDVILARPNSDGKMEVLYMLELKVNLGWGRHKLTGFEVRRDEKGKPVLDKEGKKEKNPIKPIEVDMANELLALQGVRVTSKVGLNIKRTDLKKYADDDGRLEFVFNSSVWYDLVVCSSKNVSKGALKAAKDRIAKSNNARVKMYVLTPSELSSKHASPKELATVDPVCGDDVARWGERLDQLIHMNLKEA